jgi:hypothetical protein
MVAPYCLNLLRRRKDTMDVGVRLVQRVMSYMMW